MSDDHHQILKENPTLLKMLTMTSTDWENPMEEKNFYILSTLRLCVPSLLLLCRENPMEEKNFYILRCRLCVQPLLVLLLRRENHLIPERWIHTLIQSGRMCLTNHFHDQRVKTMNIIARDRQVHPMISSASNVRRKTNSLERLKISKTTFFNRTTTEEMSMAMPMISSVSLHNQQTQFPMHENIFSMKMMVRRKSFDHCFEFNHLSLVLD